MSNILKVIIIIGSLIVTIPMMVTSCTQPHDELKGNTEALILERLKERGYQQPSIVKHSHDRNFSTGCVTITHTTKSVYSKIRGNDYSMVHVDYIQSNGQVLLKYVNVCNKMWIYIGF